MPPTSIRAGAAVSAAVTALLLAGCGSPVAPSGLPANPSESPVASRSAAVSSEPSTGPSAPPSTGPSSRPTTAGPAWHRIGTITASQGADVFRLTASATGYVASEVGDGATVDWLSTDGRSWASGSTDDPAPPCPPADGGCSSFAVSGGWEAIVATADVLSVQRSPDGVTWTVVDLPADVAADLDGTGWAAPDGTLLLLLDPSHAGTAVSLGAVTGDGAWQAVPYPAACPTNYELVLAPTGGAHARWAISDGMKACVSTDLLTWQSSTLPIKPGYPIVDWISTGLGILATGSNSDCVCNLPFQLLSADGVHWRKVRAAIGTTLIVDGPGGIVGITDNREKVPNQFVVWRITP